MSNLREMKETLCRELKEKTAFEDVELVSEVIFSVMSEVFSGEIVYFPTGKMNRIHQQVRARFTGKNH